MDTKRVRFAIDSLHYDWHHFTFSDFIRHVAHTRQRQIEIMSMNLYDYSGICLSTPKRDYIVYDAKRHPNLQLHIQLHEIAHLVLGHAVRVQVNTHDELIEWLLVHVNTRTMKLYTDPVKREQEDEAEYFAILVQNHAATHKRLHELTLTDHADDIYMPPFTGDTFTGD
ncbi:MAG: hypothetical protein RLP44_08735 [Aggregatilineales bacterium]